MITTTSGSSARSSDHSILKEGRRAVPATRSPPAAAINSGTQWPGTYGGSRDRKSTRLNSSHLVISYAVFCLKKKKIHTILDQLNPLNAQHLTLRDINR